MKGRIFFPGNPWPEGHEIQEFRWSALRRGSDVWFGFHLVSVEYYAERDVEDDDDLEDQPYWEAPIVWGNYHNCTISSNEWHNGGFRAFDSAEFNLERMDGARFHVDPLPRDLLDGYETRAFHIYLLGHDAVAGHDIQFTRLGSSDRFNIRWEGRIALAYSGDYEPRYHFVAEIEDVPFPSLIP